MAVCFLATPLVIAGQEFSDPGICAGCHGIKGDSGSPMWPNLAGQDEAYMIKQLQDFRMGVQANRRLPESDQMVVIARTLSDTDIRTLARYYSQLPVSPQVSAPVQYDAARNTYAQCIACHGKNAEGNTALAAPMLAGQHARYIERQLQAYRDGLRISPDAAMQASVKNLKDDEIAVLSRWFESLTRQD